MSPQGIKDINTHPKYYFYKIKVVSNLLPVNLILFYVFS